MGICHKMDIILDNKIDVINVKNKKCAPRLIFFNEKKIEKFQMIFDVENLLLESNFGTL